MTDFFNYGTRTNFNDPSTSLGNMKKGFTLRFWSLTYMKNAAEEIVFKAFITDFADDYASNWTEDTVYGRQDPLSVFQNTVRTITVGVEVPASTLLEGKMNLYKMQQLVQGVYPVYESYDKVPVLQAAPLWKIKFSNFITAVANPNASAKTGGLTCKINGISFTPDFEPGMFVENGAFYPKNINLNFECTVFHNHTVGFNSSKVFQTKNNFIYPYGVKSGGEQLLDELVTAGKSVWQKLTQPSQKDLEYGPPAPSRPPGPWWDPNGAIATAAGGATQNAAKKAKLKTPDKKIKSKIKKKAKRNMGIS